MQYLIVRTVRISIRQRGQDPQIMSDGAVENVVVETDNMADAVAYGILGKVIDGGDSMQLIQFTVLNVIPIEDASRSPCPWLCCYCSPCPSWRQTAGHPAIWWPFWPWTTH